MTAPRLSRGQAAFLDAVRARRSEMFHLVVTDAVEAMGLVRWVGGTRSFNRCVFSAAEFELTERGRRA